MGYLYVNLWSQGLHVSPFLEALWAGHISECQSSLYCLMARTQLTTNLNNRNAQPILAPEDLDTRFGIGQEIKLAKKTLHALGWHSL